MFAEQPMVSIVVPVYNAEQYLMKCVKSILGQTYENIEVILVDDGSKDNSGKICDELASDYRVRAYHKVNGGVSSARNYGIENAQGEYISFVDSDDTLEEKCIEKLMMFMLTNSYDLVGTYKHQKFMKKNTVINLLEMPEKLLAYLAADAYSIHAFIFRMDILKRMNIRFREDMTCSEDALFNRQYFCNCHTIFLTPEKLYKYNTENENSLSHKRHVGYASYFVEKMKVLNELCMRIKLSEQSRKRYLSYRAIHGLKISLIHYASHWTDKNELGDLFQKTIDLFKPYITKLPLKNLKLALWYLFHRPFMRQKYVNYLAWLVKIDVDIRRIKVKRNKTIKKIFRSIIGG